ncbi:heparin sulfate O-sulfotransferase [Daktulosphaira vitifoliae]|uniref:heparin sulfate O-sulfotransferase n=1 Tax=Daktulosphaira vitifoliae TaxID=58002 RepID=UPI0021AA8429|nr:heparin sulfate O-sulfotransferase [Daktulosphaira vitifoliae]
MFSRIHHYNIVVLIGFIICLYYIYHLEYKLQYTLAKQSLSGYNKEKIKIAEDLYFKQQDKEVIVIYNRVPKTGSTSFVNVAYDLYKKNAFHVIHVNITGNAHVLPIDEQIRFIRNTTMWNERKPALYHGHFGFIDFHKYGTSQPPFYINIIRKPMDRLISYYYFLRYGDNYRPHLIRKKHGDKITFDECVNQRGTDCHPNLLWLQIPFLCGQSARCWIPGNTWALEEAKRNVVSKYMIVGVTEHLLDFIEVLEAALPNMFQNASMHFKHSSKSHLRKTVKKFKPSAHTINIFKNSTIWQMENDLYNFVYEHFQFIKQHTLPNTLKGSSKFRYEKIYPKSNWLLFKNLD